MDLERYYWPDLELGLSGRILRFTFVGFTPQQVTQTLQDIDPVVHGIDHAVADIIGLYRDIVRAESRNNDIGWSTVITRGLLTTQHNVDTLAHVDEYWGANLTKSDIGDIVSVLVSARDELYAHRIEFRRDTTTGYVAYASMDSDNPVITLSQWAFFSEHPAPARERQSTIFHELTHDAVVRTEDFRSYLINLANPAAGYRGGQPTRAQLRRHASTYEGYFYKYYLSD